MKTITTSLLLALTLATAANAQADGGRLFGSYQLQEFTIISAAGNETPFCEGATGSILYEQSGHMSVSINCGPAGGAKVPADAYGRMLFYAGAFEVHGDAITHKIENSSEASLIGKSLVRKVAVLTETRLVLTGPLGNRGDTLRISWTRPAPKTANPDAFAMLTHLKVKPGMEAALIKEIATVIEASRSEPGNIAWFVQQSKEDPTEFVFYTRWMNQEALDYHLTSAPLATYIKRSAPLLAQPAKLVRYTPVDSE